MARPLRIKQLDARSVQALAHPLRSRLLASLRVDGPGTASTLAERLGESSGATSYHLRVLAQHGFIDEDRSRGRGRERWWRSAHDATSWRPEQFRDDPDAQAAEQWLSGAAVRTGMERLDGWIARRPSADPAWVAASEESDYRLTMTPPQLRRLMQELHEVVLRHRDVAEDARGDSDLAPAGDPGARAVWLLMYAFPAGEGA
jgi:predicted ArsR family transcriptional regulator